MNLRSRCEGNVVPNPRRIEHATPMWDALSIRSKDAVKVARKQAKDLEK